MRINGIGDRLGANKNGELVVRSSGFDNQPTILKRRQRAKRELGAPDGSDSTTNSNQEKNMTCLISVKYPSQQGKASDCFDAIHHLYTMPGLDCVICRTCAVLPIIGEESVAGGEKPSLPQDVVNSEYDRQFGVETSSTTGKKFCQNYQFPAGYKKSKKPHIPDFYPLYLLGMLDNQDEKCKECSKGLSNEIFQYGG